MQNPTRSDALHGRRLELDTNTPWWYCTACHAYWIPRGNKRSNGEAMFASDDRVPMRNFLEGYFTRWHIDMGFPYLWQQLERLYPDLDTLPSVTDALAWQRRYLKWVAMLRESKRTELSSRRTSEQLTLAKDVEAEGA